MAARKTAIVKILEKVVDRGVGDVPKSSANNKKCMKNVPRRRERLEEPRRRRAGRRNAAEGEAGLSKAKRASGKSPCPLLLTSTQTKEICPGWDSGFRMYRNRIFLSLAALVAYVAVSTSQGLTLHHYTDPPHGYCAGDYYTSFLWHASGSGFVPDSYHSWSLPGWVYGGAYADGSGNIEADFWLSWCCYGGFNGTDRAPVWVDGGRNRDCGSHRQR